MSPDKLAYMANQIGKFFAHQPHDKAVAAINDHLRKFWDPRMRGTIVHICTRSNWIRQSARQLNNCANRSKNNFVQGIPWHCQ